MIKKINWTSTRTPDYEPFYLYIGFSFEGTEKDYQFLVDHYHHLADAYRLDRMIFHKWERNGPSLESYIRVHLRKTSQSHVLPPLVLLKTLENDVRCLQRTFRLPEVIICTDHLEIGEYLDQEWLKEWQD
jgi:hypothetical protein